MKDIQLRDYQVASVEEIRSAFREKRDPVLFVLPTGGGKTYTFSYIAAHAGRMKNSVCIIVHRKELLLQASKSLRNLGIEHGLISPHFTPDPHQLIQVASIDTLVPRLKKRAYNPKLVIFDESHHVTLSNKWGKIWEQLGKPRTLGVTATPKRGDGIGLGDGHGGIFRTMVLGPTVAELIQRGMLINPIVYTSMDAPDLSDLKTNKEGEYNLNDLAVRVDKPQITGNAVAHYTKLCPGARAIVFCASIAHAEHVVAEFNAAGYRFAILVGEPHMTGKQRDEVNKMLARGELDGAATVDLVSEGYDLPDLECCIMLRPTASESLFLQQVGRVMRPSPGKMLAWLLDHVGNVGRRIDGEFKRKHGLPGEAREWSLEGKKKRGRKSAPDDAGPKVKQCPKCYMVFEPAPTCPTCGHVMPVASREIEQVDGELVQVTPELAAQLKKERQREVGRARTLPELQKIAEERGYSKGWAWHTYNSRKKSA